MHSSARLIVAVADDDGVVHRTYTLSLIIHTESECGMMCAFVFRAPEPEPRDWKCIWKGVIVVVTLLAANASVMSVVEISPR